MSFMSDRRTGTLNIVVFVARITKFVSEMIDCLSTLNLYMLSELSIGLFLRVA